MTDPRPRPADPSAASVWFAVLAASCAALGLGCQDEGKRFECRCGFLTDYDDSSVQAVEVCAATAGDAPAAARGCAQSAAPAPVQSCECAASESRDPCRVGVCKAASDRPD